MGQVLLAVASHLGVLVVEVMILEGGTQLGRELVAQGNRHEGRHVVARLDAILIGSHLVGKLRQGIGTHHRSRQFLGVVLSIDLGTELIAQGNGEWSLTIVEADDRREAPTLLQAVELQVDELLTAHCRNSGGCYVATVVAIVVVGTQTHGSSDIVGQLISEVHLTAIDILLALHL